MNGGWKYRVLSVGGVVFISGFAVILVNNAAVQSIANTLPILSRLPSDPPGTTEFTIEIFTTIAVFVVAFGPLYKPRPRRILDMVLTSQKRVALSMVSLAAIGYFDYTYRLPRLTVLLVTPLLLVALPMWFVWIRRRPTEGDERALILGDDPEQIKKVAEVADFPILGYLCPTGVLDTYIEGQTPTQLSADGGQEMEGLERIGGLSRIEDVLVEYDVDTAILAFERTDRAEFFGAVDACYEHGVLAKVHREHADSVLTAEGDMGEIVDIEIEPWDVQDYAVKRMFDVIFSSLGLVISLPIMAAIAVGIKVEDGGPVLYSQERTAAFGETFTVYKFRSMAEGDEDVEPAEDEDSDNITRVGGFIRRTHLDEIPQLWSILIGDMSVVGPRAVWTEEEAILESETKAWRQRWFVKPGLTGLAQINRASSTRPNEKLRYDLEYIRRQSFWFDIKIIIRQLWLVGNDTQSVLTER